MGMTVDELRDVIGYVPEEAFEDARAMERAREAQGAPKPSNIRNCTFAEREEMAASWRTHGPGGEYARYVRSFNVGDVCAGKSPGSGDWHPYVVICAGDIVRFMSTYNLLTGRAGWMDYQLYAMEPWSSVRERHPHFIRIGRIVVELDRIML